MLLLELPTEVLALIVHHVGSASFGQDLGRLTLCRAWYPLAQRELHSAVTITTGMAYRLLTRLQQDPQLALPAWAQERTRSLTFYLSNAAPATRIPPHRPAAHPDSHRLESVLSALSHLCWHHDDQLSPSFWLLAQLPRLARLAAHVVLREDGAADGPFGRASSDAAECLAAAVEQLGHAAHPSHTASLGRAALPATLRELDLTLGLVAAARQGLGEPYGEPGSGFDFAPLRAGPGGLGLFARGDEPPVAFGSADPPAAFGWQGAYDPADPPAPTEFGSPLAFGSPIEMPVEDERGRRGRRRRAEPSPGSPEEETPSAGPGYRHALHTEPVDVSFHPAPEAAGVPGRHQTVDGLGYTGARRDVTSRPARTPGRA